MYEFQNLLKDTIKESEDSIYSLSTKAGIERSYLSKILSGKRKMSFENFISIVESINENDSKRQEIVNAYIKEVFGRDKFESYFANLTADVPESEQGEKVAVSIDIKDGLTILNSKLNIFNFAEFLISNENDSTHLYTNFPVDYLLTISKPKEGCDFRCIVSTGSKDKTVSIFEFMQLNYLCCTSYIDESGSMSKNKQSFYPYQIITDSGVMFVNKNFEKGYYIKNPELAELYMNDFRQICKYMKVSSQIHDDVLNVKEPIAKYLFGRQVHRVLTNNLCVVAFMTRNDWDELAREDLPDRGYLINTTYEYYQEFFGSIGCHYFLAPLDGLAQFGESGIVAEMPVEYSRPLSVETRIAILERMVAFIRENPEKCRLNFLRSKNLDYSDIAMSIESSFDENADYKTTLITLSDDKTQKTHFPGNYLFLSTDKDAITEYNNFFDLLRISDKVMTEEETIAAMEDRILRLKYNAENINNAIEV